MNRSLATTIVANLPLLACQCADPTIRTDADEALDRASDDSASDGGDGSDGDGATGTIDDPIDTSRFMGVFHNDFAFIPVGQEVDDVGDPTIANLEIRPDGTARMRMETCDPNIEIELTLRWEARPGPMLEFFPGPGEESLRFMARSGLESVVAKLGDGCDVLFELDGQPLWMEPFRPGRACWINRCETPDDKVHIDYCDGEAPPCE